MYIEKIVSDSNPSASPSRFFEVQLSLDATPMSQMIVQNLHHFILPGQAVCDFVTVASGKDNSEEEMNRQFELYSQTLRSMEYECQNRYFIRDARSVEEGVFHHIQQYTPYLLVMGMHQTPPKRHFWRILSNSYAIARHVPCSVFIYKRPLLAPPKLKVLFTTDGSIQAGSGAALLTLFLPKANIDLSICSVISEEFYSLPSLESYVDYTELKRGLEVETTQLLARTREFFEGAGYNVTKSYFMEGDPVEKILEEIKRNDIDLVVLGSSSKGGHLSSWLLGDVSAKILEFSQASVAILR